MYEPNISASIAIAIINGVMRGREERVFKGKKRQKRISQKEEANQKGIKPKYLVKYNTAHVYLHIEILFRSRIHGILSLEK